MLVKDEAAIERSLRGLQRERTAHEINAWTMEQLSNARVVEDIDISPVNPDRQLGKLLPDPSRLEAELKRCNENFHFERLEKSTGNPIDKKRLSYRLPNGELDFICIYEAGATPEWSIMKAVWTWVPDPDAAQGGAIFERADVEREPVSLQTAYELIKELGPKGARAELLRIRNDNHDPEKRPGFIKQLELRGEAIRGWRTVLVRPLQKGYITLAQAKHICSRLGGSDERANWARAAGTQRCAATI